MARRSHLNDFTRGRMIGKLKEGRSLTRVAEEFGIKKSVVLRNVIQTIGTDVRKVGGSRCRKKTAVDDRYIILHAKRARYQSASAITLRLCTATERHVSWLTVAYAFTKVTYSPIVLNVASI
ncbi:transposable element Tcb2 transposase [Trichonephila clavipes]|nr:transposable element Tcb2 transposase [Trichonephila clavipes]